MYNAAKQYLSHGWSVIPICPYDHAKVPGGHEQQCKSPGKAPLWPWKQYQTTRPNEKHLKLFWSRNPNANVGIVMGPVSNLIGIDVDGEDGAKLLHDTCKGKLPNTLEFTTPGAMGSRRYLFKYPKTNLSITTIANKGKEALRILAAGSQTVAPPSIHYSGDQYKWVPGHSPTEINPQECPDWLIELANKQPDPAPQPTQAPPANQASPEARAQAYLQKCDPAVAGQGGHNQTFKVASKLVKGFALSEPVALELLKAIYNPRCQPPWTDKELEHKVKSAAEQEGPTGYLLTPATPPAAKPGKPQPEYEAHSRTYATIETKPIDWLWRHWIALGKLAMLDGDPGLGKSTMLLDIAARVSTNGQMPDGTPGVYGKVILMSAEDAPEDTIKPRLQAAGANLDNIIDLSHVTWAGEERPFEIPKDLPLLDKTIAKHNARLIIIDPLMAFLFGADANKDQEIRRVLYRMSKIAEKRQCAAICMRHLNKSNNTKAIYRGNSSIGVIGHARVGLIVGQDPDNDQRRILAQQKNNLAPLQKSLTFLLNPIGDVCQIGWGGKSSLTADQLVAQPPSEEQKETKEDMNSAIDQAKWILENFLANGPKTVKECREECAKAGVSLSTIKRAAKKLALNLQCDNDQGIHIWKYSLPSQNLDPLQNQESQQPTT